MYTGELQIVISNLYALLEQDHAKEFERIEPMHFPNDCVTCAALRTYKDRYAWIHARYDWVDIRG